MREINRKRKEKVERLGATTLFSAASYFDGITIQGRAQQYSKQQAYSPTVDDSLEDFIKDD